MGGEKQTRLDIFRYKPIVFRQNISRGRPVRQLIENAFNGEPCPFDDRFPCHDCGVARDSLEQLLVVHREIHPGVCLDRRIRLLAYGPRVAGQAGVDLIPLPKARRETITERIGDLDGCDSDLPGDLAAKHDHRLYGDAEEPACIG